MQKIRIATLALVAFAVLALASSPVQAGGPAATCGADKPACTVSFQPEPALMSSWTFWGCWSYWAAGPCRDIFQDGSGAYWICSNCGQTQNPGPGKCSPISTQTLNTGYWCS